MYGELKMDSVQIETHGGIRQKKNHIRVLGVASWGRSPRVKDPNLYAVRHDHRR